MSTRIYEVPQFFTTHIASDHHVKADGVRFVKPPKLSPVLCLEIFGKSAFRERQKTTCGQILKRNRRGIELASMGGRFLPEVVAFGDGVLCKRRIKSGERVPGDTVLDVRVQVTLPLDVYSYFSTL